MKELKLVEYLKNNYGSSEGIELTMTVYEIAKLCKYAGQHAKAMRMCETLSKQDDFFEGDKKALPLKSIIYGDNGQAIDSYLLNKRQSLALASRLNVTFLMHVIDRWQELEGDGKKPMGKIELARENLRLTIREVELENQIKELAITLDKEHEWSSIKKQEALNNDKYKWQPLKKYSIENSIEIKRVFDQNYGEVNSYSAEVWKAVYKLDIEEEK